MRKSSGEIYTVNFEGIDYVGLVFVLGQDKSPRLPQGGFGTQWGWRQKPLSSFWPRGNRVGGLTMGRMGGNRGGMC